MIKNFSSRAVRGCTAVILFAVAGCTSNDSSVQGGTSASSAVSPSVIQPSSSAQDATTAPSPSIADASTAPASAGVASPSVADPTTRTNPTTDSDAGSSSGSASSREAEDRAAVEAQWIRFWAVYGDIGRTPVEDRARLVEEIAVEPTSSNILENAASMDAKGLDTYGKVVHHISWQAPIDGVTNAVIADCQDQSKYGSVETATGIKKTVGVPKDNMRGEFLKGADQIWRVRQIYFLTDTPC